MRRLCVALFASFVLGAVSAQAQEATITGSVVDESRAVLPGATVTATEINTGRQYFSVTDSRGEYRIVNVDPGTYRVTAELAGFATVEIPAVELLVGQNANLPITMGLAALEESITVTSESPLVDITGHEVAGNVDRRQMEDLPLSGRNWMELSMLVKGITANNVEDRPGIERDEQFQLNLDGQQITQKVASSGFGQPRFSREAIAEFQIVTNQFDITQGRSSGGQVQAISKSGTNQMSGTFYGNFRDDRFNSADFVAEQVLPFSNQQVGGALGGPIVRDRLLYFGSYEYERTPGTIFNTPALLPGQAQSFESNDSQTSFLGRVDNVLTDVDHLSVRGSYWKLNRPFVLTGSQHPSEASRRPRDATNILVSWSRVWNTNLVGELKAGYNSFNWANEFAFEGIANQPVLRFPGMNLGGPRNYPQEFHQDLFSARYDLSWHKEAHNFKIGGEYLGWKDTGEWHLLERGEFRFLSVPNDMARRFPAAAFDNPAAWDLSGLDPLVQRFDQNVGNWFIDIPRPTWAMWFGDTWRMNDKLTVNYGARWDVDWGVTAPPGVTTQITFDPAGGVPANVNGLPSEENVAISAGDRLFRNDIRDLNNVAFRGGFAYNVNGDGRLVIRGGSGLFYTTPYSNITFSQQSFNPSRILTNTFANDGLPGFIQDPTRGVTNEQILNGEVPLPPQQPRVIAHDYVMPYTWQSSIGFQKQIGPVMGFDADLVYWKQYHAERPRDINLFYDPATGFNVSPSRGGRPDPKFGQVRWIESNGAADYLALASSFTRRFRDNFQLNVTHTVMFLKNDNTNSFFTFGSNQFDLDDGEWARSRDFQRNTIRVSGIYRLPYDITIAGAYFYGSGNYFETRLGSNPLAGPGNNRLNLGAPFTVPDAVADRYEGPLTVNTGDIVPKNALRGLAIHKVDLRLSKTISLGGTVRLTGIAEVFNLFNHENFGSYQSIVDRSNFGQATQNTGNGFIPRSGQFAFKLSF